MATKAPKTPTTTVKINHQHDYSTLTIKLASGDTVRYTTSWNGVKMSASAQDEWLRSEVGMNATFKALEGMSSLAGESVAQRYLRIEAVALRAERPYHLVELLRAAETTPEQKREARRHVFLKNAERYELPPEMFGGTVKVNARGKGLIDCTVEGFDLKGSGQIECLAADGARYILTPEVALRAYRAANSTLATA